jgi:hypothetical protein
MAGVQYDGEPPRLYFNFRELELGFGHYSMLPKNDKPMLLFQPSGGPSDKEQPYPYSWARDIHPNTAQELVNNLSNVFQVVHVCYPHHPTLQNCHRFDAVINKMELFAMANNFNAFLLVDSSFQHACAALNKKATVCWNITEPTTFGYPLHKNFTPLNAVREGTADSYFFDYNFHGAAYECPYPNYNAFYNIDDIVNSCIESIYQ